MLEFQAKNVFAFYEEIDRVDRIIDNLEDFYRGPAMRSLRYLFLELFRKEGATARTQKWAPLKTQTKIGRYRRHYKYSGKRGRPNRKILWDTGLLRQSYVDDPVVRISRNVMRYSSIVSYAKYHETGTRYMPARPVIGYAAIVGPTRLQRALNKWIREKINNGR